MSLKEITTFSRSGVLDPRELAPTMRSMERMIDPADLALIVRALHRDVSDLDDRLRRVQAELAELRGEAPISEQIDLRVLGIPPGA